MFIISCVTVQRVIGNGPDVMGDGGLMGREKGGVVGGKAKGERGRGAEGSDLTVTCCALLSPLSSGVKDR